MRKLFYSFIFILSLLLSGGCNNEIIVNLKQSGTLTIRVTDENNVGIEGANCYINSYIENHTDGGYITDKEGETILIRIAQGQYTCYGEIKRGNIIYKDSKPIQIVAEENKKVLIQPFENVGHLTITLVNRLANEPGTLAGLNIALVKKYCYNLEEYISNAYFIKKIDESHLVEFEKVPEGSYYFPIVYDDSKSWYETGKGLIIRKGEYKTYTMRLYY